MFCFAGTCMSVQPLEAAGCWNPQETCSVWNAARICDFFQDSLPFLLFFPCFSHLFMITVFSGWRQDLFSAISPMCLLQSVHGTATSGRARCSSPAWIRASPWHTSSYQHLPLNTQFDGEKGTCNWKEETHGFYGYRGSYRKVFLSRLQPFLKEEVEFLNSGELVLMAFLDGCKLILGFWVAAP